MRVSHYRDPVKLQLEQRWLLEAMVQTSKTTSEVYLVAHVLLMSGQQEGLPAHTDGHIAEALSISRRTVIRIKQQFVQKNLEVALTGSFPCERPERRCEGLAKEKSNSFIWPVARPLMATMLDTGIVSRSDGASGLCGAHQPGDGENHTQKNE